MNFNRRSFLKGITAASAAVAAGGCSTVAIHRRRPGEKLNVGVIGAGGKGHTDWLKIFEHGENIVAMCDVDDGVLDRELAAYQKLGGDPSKVKRYRDYRRMIEENPSLDAVTISSPDHMHAAQAIMAMQSGMNVYVQKPLVRTLWEVKRFAEVARETGAITQMGNQGSAGMGHRRNMELLQQGILGDVTEVHVWTDRPIWPQGKLATELVKMGKAVPAPKTLDWDLWLGTAAERPYLVDRGEQDYGLPDWSAKRRGIYHQFNWRGFYDFGTGAFGDMACHTMNLPFRGLELGKVTSAYCKQLIEPSDIAYPLKSQVEMIYAARPSRVRKGVTLPEVKLVWYDGNQQPCADLMPQYVATFGKVPKTGCLIIGSKGIMVSTNDYGQEALIAFKGEKTVKGTFKHEACKALPEIICKSSVLEDKAFIAKGSPKGDLDFVSKAEFCNAIKGVGTVYDMTHSMCFSDTEHSIPMLEGMLVGCVAQRVAGKIGWDSDNAVFDCKAANDLYRPYIRGGWEF